MNKKEPLLSKTDKKILELLNEFEDRIENDETPDTIVYLCKIKTLIDQLINSAKEECAKIAEKDYNTIRLLKRDEEIRPIFKKSGDFIAKAIRDTI